MEQTTQAKSEIKNSTQLINYESVAMEAVAETYPVEMREPFLWLGNYILTQCARNLDALEHKLRQLGLPTTAGTISKIMRGRWNCDARNNPCPPCMSLNSFIDMVEKLRSSPEVGEMVKRMDFIQCPQTELIENYIDARRAPTRINRFGFIFGPTGAMKTETFKHYCSLPGNNRNSKWVETPQKPSPSHFITAVAAVYGVSTHTSVLIKLARIRANLSAKKCLILDNIQRLYLQPSGTNVLHANQEIFNLIQLWQDETGFTPILSATPEFYTEFLGGMARGYFEQFEGRAGGRHEFLVLPPHLQMEDVLVIAEKFGLEDAESHVEYLTKIARMPGRCRILFQTLQSAKEEAAEAGQPLTINFVKEVLPDSIVAKTEVAL